MLKYLISLFQDVGLQAKNFFGTKPHENDGSPRGNPMTSGVKSADLLWLGTNQGGPRQG